MVSILGLIWILISAALLLFSLLLAVFPSPAGLLIGAILVLFGLLGLALGATLIVRPHDRRRLVASALLGLALTLVGGLAIAGWSQGMVLGIEAILVFVVASSVATGLSALALARTPH